MVASEAILQEYQRVLSYPHIQQIHKKTPAQINQFIARLRSVIELIHSTGQVAVVRDDPTDNKFLSCALAGNDELLAKIGKLIDKRLEPIKQDLRDVKRVMATKHDVKASEERIL